MGYKDRKYQILPKNTGFKKYFSENRIEHTIDAVSATGLYIR
jgi:hypothetical protein